MKKKSKKNIKMVKKYTHTVDQQCPLCGKISFMRLQEQEYKQWEHYVCYRGLIQKEMPDTNKFGREFVKTGYCIECQQALFDSDISAEDEKAFFSYADIRPDIPRQFMTEMNEAKQEPEAFIASKAAEKLTIPEKVLFLREFDLEDKLYVDENGNVLAIEQPEKRAALCCSFYLSLMCYRFGTLTALPDTRSGGFLASLFVM